MIYKDYKSVSWIGLGQQAIAQVYKGMQLVWTKVMDAWYDNDIWRENEVW